MPRSMTSFGRAQNDDSKDYLLSVEMKSVNNRYLDTNIKMPKSMISLEEEVRKLITREISRGKVEVFINYKNYAQSSGVPKIDKCLAKKYYDALIELGEELGIQSDITVSKIAKYPDVITLEVQEEDLEDTMLKLKPLVLKALDAMVQMRKVEGENLKNDILSKLEIIDGIVKKIKTISEEAPIDYKKKLEERIESLTNGMQIDRERLATEVAIFADKAAIDEEIIRLGSHIAQMRNTLESNELIGRKLDFIIQEMNRETNTIGSKSNDMQLTNFVIDIKNILEKIREQVQNIE